MIQYSNADDAEILDFGMGEGERGGAMGNGNCKNMSLSCHRVCYSETRVLCCAFAGCGCDGLGSSCRFGGFVGYRNRKTVYILFRNKDMAVAK